MDKMFFLQHANHEIHIVHIPFFFFYVIKAGIQEVLGSNLIVQNYVLFLNLDILP